MKLYTIACFFALASLPGLHSSDGCIPAGKGGIFAESILRNLIDSQRIKVNQSQTLRSTQQAKDLDAKYKELCEQETKLISHTGEAYTQYITTQMHLLAKYETLTSKLSSPAENQ